MQIDPNKELNISRKLIKAINHVLYYLYLKKYKFGLSDNIVRTII